LVALGQFALSTAVSAIGAITGVIASAEAAIITFRASMYAATAQSALLAGGMGTVKAAGNVLMAAAMGWQIGSWLYDNFETARIAGLSMVAGLMRAWIDFKSGFAIMIASLGAAVSGFVKYASNVFEIPLATAKLLAQGMDLVAGTDYASKVANVQSQLDKFQASESGFKKKFQT
jgi:hypothetical protein